MKVAGLGTVKGATEMDRVSVLAFSKDAKAQLGSST